MGVWYSQGNHGMHKKGGHSEASKALIKKNNGKYWQGKNHSVESKQKIKDARAKQIITPESREKAKLKMTGDQHFAWKGDEVGYFALHTWVQRHKGLPQDCEDCGATDSDRSYDWANISGEYRRDLDDFMRLCRSCHRKFDFWKKKIA